MWFWLLEPDTVGIEVGMVKIMEEERESKSDYQNNYYIV